MIRNKIKMIMQIEERNKKEIEKYIRSGK